MKKSIGLMICILLCAGRLCPADPATHRKAVEQLFYQINVPATVNQTVDQVAASLTGVVKEDEAYRDAVDAYVRKYLGWEAMKDEIIDLYMRTFTEQEIMELINFYNTTVGRKLLDQSPVIGEAIAACVHRRLVEHSPELKKMMMDADLKAFTDYLNQEEAPPEKQH